MEEVASLSRRIAKIKKLAKEFYPMPKEALIARHDELLRLFDIRGSKHSQHPHKMMRVYISRKALKHFVEERKAELIKNHEETVILRKIFFAIDRMQEVITNFEAYELQPEGDKHFYSKNYQNEGEPTVRILLNASKKKKDALEVCSFHFRKKSK